MKWLINLSFRQYFYFLVGVALLIFAVINKDIWAGIFSVLCFVQGIFNICLFGACKIPQGKKHDRI
jgi:hypothetical protein